MADSTDVYAFVSPDKPDTVTLIANYIPLQGPAGGPNFYSFGDDVLYEIHIDDNETGTTASSTRSPRARAGSTGPFENLHAQYGLGAFSRPAAGVWTTASRQAAQAWDAQVSRLGNTAIKPSTKPSELADSTSHKSISTKSALFEPRGLGMRRSVLAAIFPVPGLSIRARI